MGTLKCHIGLREVEKCPVLCCDYKSSILELQCASVTMEIKNYEEDSDSAPEDVTFKDAKTDALEHLKTVSEAAKNKKKLRKEQIKKRQEYLSEQKQLKQQKLQEFDAKKLPSSVLEDLEDVSETPETLETKNTQINSRIVFDNENVDEDDEFDNQDESDEFIALSTNATDFKLVSSKDLKSSKFKSTDAFSFRDRMLYGGRVRREPYQNQQMRKQKLKVSGLSNKVSSSSQDS